jgi:RNA-directed DNA polymerase
MENQPTTENWQEELTIREAELPPKLRDWRAKLNAKAKQEKRFRFYSLYGMVCDPVSLQAAWTKVRANEGAPGVDGVSIEQIEREGAEAFLKNIEEDLKQKRYRCGAVRRVYIRKANGKLRPLGIPNVRDRVVQAAVKLIIEPIFEADFEDCSYGFRPGRGAHQALEAILEALQRGRMNVYDADLEGYFDSIPHDKLMDCVRMRVVDGSVLGLIRQWLRAVVVEKGGEGKPPTARRNRKGTPQGGVISPLLANIYLHWFDHVFERAKEMVRRSGAVLVRYADDFVVLARQLTGEVQAFIEAKIEGWLGLKINREKTRVLNLRAEGESLEFLGYRFGLDWDRFGRKRRFLNQSVSKKALMRERARLRVMTAPNQCWKPLPMLVEELNAHLQGWANYFAAGRPRAGFRAINRYVVQRLTRHMRRRSQRPWRCPKGMSIHDYLCHHLKLRLL